VTYPLSEDAAIPALLRAARGSYAQAISARLAAAGFDDVPRNGAFVLGGMANWGGSAAEVIQGLGVTKQAASQLIDTLVLRGYLERDINPDDRRRMAIEPTDRGRAAAATIREAVEAIDAELAQMLTPAEQAGLRAGLTALADIRTRTREGS
jgi:DNA-binding MarR family transcriptional regulator